MTITQRVQRRYGIMRNKAARVSKPKTTVPPEERKTRSRVQRRPGMFTNSRRRK